MLAYLAGEGLLQHQGGRWYWVADSYPANAVSLRSVAEGNFVVIDADAGGGRVIWRRWTGPAPPAPSTRGPST